MSKKFVKLGVCRKVHGIKGEFTFNLENAQESILNKNTIVKLIPLEGSVLASGEQYIISSIRSGNKTICALEGVTDRNLAESMVPFEVHCDRDLFPKLEDGEFYLSDLMGADVYSHLTKEKIGVITKFYNSGAGDIAVIRMKTEIIELPVVDRFFKEINPDENKVVIVIPKYV